MPKGNQQGSIEIHNGRLRLVYFVDGKRKREVTGQLPDKEGYKAARAILKRRLAEIETGAYEEPNETSCRTFSDYAGVWLASLTTAKNREGRPFKPASIERYRRLLNAWKLQLGQLRMDRITDTDIRAAEAKVLAGKSQNHSSNLVVVLKKVLRQAEADGEITRQLTAKIKSPLPEKRRLVEGEVWSKDEAAEIQAAALEIDPAYYALCCMGLMAGMRNGEIRAFPLENIDMAGRVLRVRLTAGEDYKEPMVGTPKTQRSIRDLDIDDRLLAIIRDQVKRAMAAGSKWLFPDPLDKDRILPYWRLYDWNDLLAKRLGRKLPPHRLRHTFASTAISNGAPLAEVAEYMGDTQATVERVYFAWIGKDAKRKAASRFASMYDSAPIVPLADATTG